MRLGVRTAAFVGAIGPGAVGVNVQAVVADGETACLRNLFLAFFDLAVVELLDMAALQADQVVVMAAAVEFEHRLAGFEVVALEQPGLLELGQHPVDSGEPGVGAFLDQFFVDVLGGKVAYRAFFKQLENAQSRQGGLEPDVFEMFRGCHGVACIRFRPAAGESPALARGLEGHSEAARAAFAACMAVAALRFDDLNLGYDISNACSFRVDPIAAHQTCCTTNNIPDLVSAIAAITTTAIIVTANTRPMRFFALFFLAAVAALAAGCAKVPVLPGLEPYRIDIPQGNYVTQDMVEKLKPGMTRSQVRFALGTPLVVDSFRTDRWDYFYMLHKAGQLAERRLVTVVFKGDELLRIEGDVVAAPSRASGAGQ